MNATRFFSPVTRGLATATAAVFLFAASAVQDANAGEPDVVITDTQITVEDIYEGGRGILTTTGPTGLFINPTSGTMPAGSSTVQYCFFLPAGSTFDPSGHGWIASYGVTDALEIGASALYTTGNDQFSIGPMARYRFLKDEGPGSLVPEFSLVGYSRFGDDFKTLWGLAPTVFKRIPIGDESGLVKSIGVHGGARYEHNDGTASSNLWNGFGGIEVQLPARLYLVGEVSSKETGRGETRVPYAFGVQWRQGLINISTAGIQNGSLPGPRFFFGVGLGFQF